MNKITFYHIKLYWQLWKEICGIKQLLHKYEPEFDSWFYLSSVIPKIVCLEFWCYFQSITSRWMLALQLTCTKSMEHWSNAFTSNVGINATLAKWVYVVPGNPMLKSTTMKVYEPPCAPQQNVQQWQREEKAKIINWSRGWSNSKKCRSVALYAADLDLIPNISPEWI